MDNFKLEHSSAQRCGASALELFLSVMLSITLVGSVLASDTQKFAIVDELHALQKIAGDQWICSEVGTDTIELRSRFNVVLESIIGASVLTPDLKTNGRPFVIQVIYRPPIDYEEYKRLREAKAALIDRLMKTGDRKETVRLIEELSKIDMPKYTRWDHSIYIHRPDSHYVAPYPPEAWIKCAELFARLGVYFWGDFPEVD